MHKKKSKITFLEFARMLPFAKLVTTARNNNFDDNNRNAARFKDILTDDEADKYHQYLKKARQEWDRNI